MKDAFFLNPANLGEWKGINVSDKKANVYLLKVKTKTKLAVYNNS